MIPCLMKVLVCRFLLELRILFCGCLIALLSGWWNSGSWISWILPFTIHRMDTYIYNIIYCNKTNVYIYIYLFIFIFLNTIYKHIFSGLGIGLYHICFNTKDPTLEFVHLLGSTSSRRNPKLLNSWKSSPVNHLVFIYVSQNKSHKNKKIPAIH